MFMQKWNQKCLIFVFYNNNNFKKQNMNSYSRNIQMPILTLKINNYKCKTLSYNNQPNNNNLKFFKTFYVIL